MNASPPPPEPPAGAEHGTAVAGWARAFLLPWGLATIGGGLWAALGLPLGWLLGAAIVAGGFAITGQPTRVPALLHRAGLIIVGVSVGLWITPKVAGELLGWLPAMIGSACLGVSLAALMTPLFARSGRLDKATAYFSLLPGGVIEMANIGDRYHANRAAIAALHAIRVGLIVTLLPAALLLLYPPSGSTAVPVTPVAAQVLLWLVPICGLAGWGAARLRMPTAWFLAPMIAAGVISGSGLIASGHMPATLLLVAKLVVGFSLGAKFKREAMRSLPRAIAIGIPLLILIGGLCAGAAIAVDLLIGSSEPVPTLILGFSIGGMAEMVLTAKALSQNAALVAAFHAVRAVSVNLLAGPLWARISRYPLFKD